MAHFDELMQRALTVRNNVAPSSNTAILVGGVLVSIVSALQLLLDTKQGTLTFDTTPTDGSTNPVTSDGIYEAIAAALANIDLSACEKIVNKVTALSAQSTDVQYPSAKCVYDALQTIDLSACEKIVNKVTSLSAQSTNTQYPSAKAVYDCCIAVQAVLQSLDERVTRLEAFHYETYYIRGTSTNIGGTETFTITMADLLTGATSAVAFTAEVDANGAWEVEYKGKKIYSLNNVWQGKTTLTTIEFTEELDECTSMGNTFRNCTALTSVTFDSRLNLHKVTTMGNANNNNQAGIFNGCSALTSISSEFFAQNFEALTVANGAFKGCAAYTSTMVFTGTMPLLADVRNMFYGCGAVSVSFTAAAMANVTNVGGMFNVSAATSVSMPAATFASLIVGGHTQGGPKYGFIHNCANLVSIDLSAATFAALTDSRNMFRENPNLETITWGQNVSFNALSIAGATGNYATGMFFGCAKLTTASVAVFANQQLQSLTNGENMFNGCAAITALDLSSATFASMTSAAYMFAHCKALASIDLSAATFAALTNAQSMFNHCEALTSLDLSGATFSNLVNMADMFGYCKAMQSLTFSNNLNLDKVTSTGNIVNSNNAGLFRDCIALTSVSAVFFSQNFAELVNAWAMFRNCALTAIALTGTLPKLAQPRSMFHDSKATSITINSTLATVTNPYAMFYGSTTVQTISMPNATFEAATDTRDMFTSCTALTSLTVPGNSTAVAPSAGVGTTPINTRWSALDYASMLRVANWLRDFTGGTAHTVTFKTSAWNALTAAEQANIDAILSAKNWTRAIA